MDYDRRELQSRVEDALWCSGSGTELVTVWIPPGKNIDTVRSRLQGEASEAENIKSKQTRERVIGALNKVLNLLHKYRDVPENGLVLCAGYVDSEYVTFEFNSLPQPIRDSKYVCDDSFDLDELETMAFGGSEWWGLLTVTRDSASIGRYTNTNFDHVDVIDSFESHVMGKSKAGGQSQARFARLREEQQHNHYKKVKDIVVHNFDPADEDFQGVAIGGPNVAVSDFVEYLPANVRDCIVTVERVDHAGSRESLATLAERAEDAFSEQERAKERELVNEFKERLRDGSEVAYGESEVELALRYDAVDTLLISADLATHVIGDYKKLAEEQGGNAEIISTMHEEGRQLDMVFGGVAALLRFDIQ